MFNRSILFYEASMPANYSTGKTYTYKSKIVSGTPILTNTATPVATPATATPVATPETQTVTQTPGWLKRNYGKAITVGTLSTLTGGGVLAKNYIEDKDDQSRKEKSDEIDKNFKNVMARRATAKVVDVSPEVKPATEVKPVSDNKYARDLNRTSTGSINQGTNIALGIGAGIGALALARKLRKKKTNLKEI